MSDVREELIRTLKSLDYLESDELFADAILARWDLMPKPVVTTEKLGQMVAGAAHSSNSFYHVDVATKVGNRMLDQLDAAGLRLVRVEDGD